MRKVVAALSLALALGAAASAQAPSTRAIKLAVDARLAPRKVLHAKLAIPVSAGPLTLSYPKWMPADHSPDGPIANLTGLKFFADGKAVPWRRDPVEMYDIHLQIPPGTRSLSVDLDFLLSAPGPTIDFSGSASSQLLILMWNQVLLYPKGAPANRILFEPSLQLPEGWKFNTSLPVASQSGNQIDFAPVDVELLVDSPVQSGRYTRVIPLSENPRHEVDVAADDAWALEIPPALIENYKRLVAEASALYRSHPYRSYHFLLTLSDNVIRLGQEHHESSDDRVPEHTLVDPNARLTNATLFPHEFTHSWNGQFRRPSGLATPDFQQPMNGEMLWVYEGLTDYLGTILAARSGLWTPEQTREQLASLASMLDHRVGRTWRSLQDTADAAQILYFAPSEWASMRRGTDFYTESVLLWLEVDVRLRKLTNGQRSLDDFCHSFYGGAKGLPVVEKFGFDDVVAALNSVASYDWRALLRQRLEATNSGAPLEGITSGGWQLVYNDVPNEFIAANQAVSGAIDLTSSLGLVVRGDGYVQDAIAGMPGFESGLSPFMRILGVGDRPFSIEELGRAVENAKSNETPIKLLVSNTGSLETITIPYHGGLRGPHLERAEGVRDYLSEILKPLAGETR